jgi:hypothetical protein
VTLFRLLGRRTVADFAEWYRAGAEYTRTVAVGMGFDGVEGSALTDIDDTAAALRAGEADLRPEEARVVATTFLADAGFSEPFLEYTPAWYRAVLLGPIRLADRRLRDVAEPFAARAAEAGERPTVPDYSRPADVGVAGAPPTAGIEGFRGSFLLADAVLHLEWFVAVAAAAGVDVPRELIERTRRESVAHYAGEREGLSPRVRRFQYYLFADDAWVRDVNTTYRLNSALLGVWSRLLRGERARLRERGAESSV